MPVINRRMGTGRGRDLLRAKAEGLRIAWITETHLWSVVDDQPDHPDATPGGDLYFYTAGRKLDQVIDHLTADPPDFTLHTGDVMERGRDFAFARSYWDRVPGPKAYTIGNHDVAFTVTSGETHYQVVAEGFGRENEPELGGSVFNQSIVVTGNGVQVRVILADTNKQSNGLHAASSRGYLQPEALAWIEAELAASPQDVILIATHHGPHSHGLRFDPVQAAALQAIVDAEVAARPSRRIRGIFGHWHIQRAAQTFHNLGPNFPGVLGPALVDLEVASYLDLYVTADGVLAWEPRTVTYNR